ncbi:Synaptosomal-associated protein [Desmophyllum pertusum]|uniref:Synaptosomal-associated protein n=1 Tax=Desmophyllum pertusum TaxID=174260 RepID=A0A9W9Z5X9_9CNID|nr:Synaptosomal-associated protein [Desmophyllum pertusum]
MAAYSRNDFNRKQTRLTTIPRTNSRQLTEMNTQSNAAGKRSTLDSTRRSLALIEDSHDIAIQTGEELQCQGEQLNRIERNLDKITSDMSIANRHIKSVNSVFGAIGNYFKKAPKPKDTSPQSSPGSGLSDLQADASLYYRTRDSESRGYEAGARGSGQFQRSAFSSRDPHERESKPILTLCHEVLVV